MLSNSTKKKSGTTWLKVSRTMNSVYAAANQEKYNVFNSSSTRKK